MVLQYLLPNPKASKMAKVLHYSTLVTIVLLCVIITGYGIYGAVVQSNSSSLENHSSTLNLSLNTDNEVYSSSSSRTALKLQELLPTSLPTKKVYERDVSVSITGGSDNKGSESYGISDFGEECETNGKQCHYSKYLECIDGKCMCQNPYHRAYDEDLQQCVSLVGSGCGGNGPECVKHSKCTYGSCQCSQGFSETTTKLCLKNRGLSCKPNECNADQGLACIQGTCQCIDSLMVYQPFSNKCINPQAEFDNFARNLVQRIVLGKISRTVSGAKSLVFLPVRLLVPGIG